MKGKQTINFFIAAAIILLASCGGGQQQSNESSSAKASKKLNLPNDPCELVLHVISTLREGPETFNEAFFDFNDLQKLKKDFPDLEVYFDLWKKNNDHEYLPSSEVLQMIYIEREAAEKNINISDLFDRFKNEYYLMLMEQAKKREWIWDEIRMRDCLPSTENEYTIDHIHITNDDETITIIVPGQYTLPFIGEAQANIFINEYSSPWVFMSIETKQGWKLFMPDLHNLHQHIKGQ
jgi:hypothetical protein